MGILIVVSPECHAVLPKCHSVSPECATTICHRGSKMAGERGRPDQNEGVGHADAPQSAVRGRSPWRTPAELSQRRTLAKLFVIRECTF